MRRGGSRRSSTRSIPGRSPTPTVTGSATWPASGPISPIWPGWGSTPCGSRRSTARPWPTSATTSATTATSIPLFGTLDDFDGWWTRPTPRASGSSSTGCPTTPRTGTPGSSTPRSGPDSEHRNWYVWRDARPDGLPTQQLGGGLRPDRSRPGPSTGHRSSGTSTSSSRPSPTSTGTSPGWCDGHARRAAVLARPGRRRVPGRRHPLHRQGPRPARRSPAGGRHPPLRPQRRPSDPPPAAGHPGLVDDYPGDRVVVGEVYLLSTDGRRHLLRGRRRAPPGLQLPAAVRPLGQDERGRPCIEETVDALDPAGRLADLGAVQSRQPPPSHPLRPSRASGPGRTRRPQARRSEAGPGRRRAAAHPAGHALPLSGRGARTARCGDPRPIRRSTRAVATGAGHRSPGRVDDDHGWPTAARASSRGCPSRPKRTIGTTRHSAVTRAPSSISTGVCWLCATGRRHCSPAPSSCWTRPRGSSASAGRSDDDAWVVLVNFTDRVFVDVPRSTAGTASSPGGVVRLSSDGVGEGAVASTGGWPTIRRWWCSS